jgi:hypothetical protein
VELVPADPQAQERAGLVQVRELAAELGGQARALGQVERERAHAQAHTRAPRRAPARGRPGSGTRAPLHKKFFTDAKVVFGRDTMS